MTTTTLAERPATFHPDKRNVRTGRQFRAPRLLAWATLEGASILLQFAGFMVVLLAQGLSKAGTRALGRDAR